MSKTNHRQFRVYELHTHFLQKKLIEIMKAKFAIRPIILLCLKLPSFHRTNR